MPICNVTNGKTLPSVAGALAGCVVGDRTANENRSQQILAECSKLVKPFREKN